jgi:hypothetical protein
MAEPPPHTDSHDPGLRPDPAPTTGPPLWLKVFGIVALIVVVVFVVVMLTGVGGGHGPGRHVRSEDPPGGNQGPSGATGHSPPGGHTP